MANENTPAQTLQIDWELLHAIEPAGREIAIRMRAGEAKRLTPEEVNRINVAIQEAALALKTALDLIRQDKERYVQAPQQPKPAQEPPAQVPSAERLGLDRIQEFDQYAENFGLVKIEQDGLTRRWHFRSSYDAREFHLYLKEKRTHSVVIKRTVSVANTNLANAR